ncbi:MAG TPA: glycine cleavage system aminomethyltransferase GcvT [Magnetospirillaceae bacterium]
MSQDPHSSDTAALLRTPLHALHVELGAKMVPFAGYDMPVQYPAGVLTEHKHTRAAAGLFDVSHMGQVTLHGAGLAEALEKLVPGDIAALAPGRTRYTLFTNDAGGILDDLMVTNAGDHLFLVVNAACKTADIAHMRAALPKGITLDYLEDRALMALQGPQAVTVMERHLPGAATLKFMSWQNVTVAGFDCFVTRSGYTGEDGFEISAPAAQAEALARTLLAEPEVAPIGLGARDSLRLEAGLCLYGSDLDMTTTPVEAALVWTMSKRRREQGGFPGDAVIKKQLTEGAPRLRVGLKPQDRAPARGHTPIVGDGDAPVGEVTSGGFGPSVDGPIAMGYVRADLAKDGTALGLMVRGARRAASVVSLPFAPHRYHKG